jgi:hypothetical protein
MHILSFILNYNIICIILRIKKSNNNGLILGFNNTIGKSNRKQFTNITIEPI